MNAATTMRPEVIWADMGGLDNRDLWSLLQACHDDVAEAQAAVVGANQAYEDVRALYGAASERQLAAWRAETAAQLHLALVASEISIITAKSPAERAQRMREAQRVRAMFDVWATGAAPAPKTPEVPVAPSTVPQPSGDLVTLSQLSVLYLEEQADQLQASSIRDMKSAFKTLAEALTDPETREELNLKTHTRADMVKLKADLTEGRKPLTVNKLLTRLNTLLTWAENNGYIEKAFNKGLKISKGAESGRKAFTEEQIQTLMDRMAELPVSSWKRWAMSLGAITGARIGEIFQLTKADVRRIGDVVVIDMNTNDGKSLKNKHSNRVVPLVDGAYGFDLQAFLTYVESCEDKLFDRVSHNFTRVLNETLRDVLQHDSGEGLTYHSLRHSLAGLMKHHGIQVSIVQGILGHSSQTITFDLYGGDSRLAVGKLEEAMKACFLGKVRKK